MKKLLIEGWRGVNHSYALVNQHQILHWARTPNLRLFHRDLPYAYPHWHAEKNDAGFADEERRVINGLQPPHDSNEQIDVIYRVCSPFRATEATSSARTVTFMAVEFALGPSSFLTPADRARLIADDGPIITTSRWSKERIEEGGFAANRIAVVPHGVNAATFRALDSRGRQIIRERLGVAQDETVFLHVGAPFLYKGIDLLLCAFAELRLHGLRVRLIVKDQSAVYGLKLESVIAWIGEHDQRLRDERVLSGIAVIPNNMPPDELSNLFGIADCYVSPYRAEGFNLPVLEAIACGVPTIVTAGGATDDFCDDNVSIRIPGRLQRRTDEAGAAEAFIEPDFPALVDAMTMIARGFRRDPVQAELSRQAVLKRHDWGTVANRALQLCLA